MTILNSYLLFFKNTLFCIIYTLKYNSYQKVSLEFQMSKQRQDEYKCPLEVTMEIIGGKYKGVIIGHLIDKTLRYNELQKLISHATPKMLIQQLKELEADGIIQRKLYPVVPPKTEYSLTERGKRLIPSIIELNKWGLAYLKEMDIPCKYKEE